MSNGDRSTQYYSSRLSAERLKQCYDIAPPRTKQYLLAELDHVQKHIAPHHRVLELGCGYGRVLSSLEERCSHLVGIDVSRESLSLAQSHLAAKNTDVIQMNAGCLAFDDASFDVVVCIQNGISAFKLKPANLLREAIRVANEDGICLFSSYSERFWESRLDWFRLQADAGLIGPISWDMTKDGTIVCKDGFTATTFTPSDFEALADQLSLNVRIREVDQSSVFCEVYC